MTDEVESQPDCSACRGGGLVRESFPQADGSTVTVKYHCPCTGNAGMFSATREPMELGEHGSYPAFWTTDIQDRWAAHSAARKGDA